MYNFAYNVAKVFLRSVVNGLPAVSMIAENGKIRSTSTGFTDAVSTITCVI